MNKYQKALIAHTEKMKQAKIDLGYIKEVIKSEPPLDPFDISLPLKFAYDWANEKGLIIRHTLCSYNTYPLHKGYSKESLYFNFDVYSSDSKYIARVFKLISASTKYNNAKTIIKAIKARRYENRFKEWEDVLPVYIVKWARNVLNERSQECDCVDNYRVANVRKSSQMRRYRRYKNNGCCGFCDFIKFGPDGNKYILGFNHGH
jgi:hypothetical protein